MKLGNTMNWETFVVRIFSYSMLCAKIKLKCMHIINVSVHGKGSFVRKLFNTKSYCINTKFGDLQY